MKNLFLSFGLLASWISVQAQCGTLSPVTLPLSEGFESYSGTVNQDAVLNCTSTYRWDFNVGGNLGVIGFDTDSIMGAHAAVLTGTSRLSDTSQLMLTANMSSYTSASGPIVLSFFYKDGGDSYNAPDKVWVRGSNVDSWIEILDWSNTTTNKFWTLASFRLDSILSANSQSFGASTQVLWSRYGGGPYSVAGGLAIDEVLISDGACALPSALAASSVSPGSVVLDWAGSGSAWEVAYGLPGGPIDNVVSVSSKPATISGLATSTTYDFYVRNTCAANSNSAWVGPLSVYIPCNTYQAPYSNDFESSVTGSAPDCWTQYSNISFPSAVVNTAGNPYSGTKQLVMNSSNGKAADTLYAISPQFTDLVAGDKEISIRVAIDNVASKLIVGTTPDASGKGAFTALDTISFSSTFTHKEVFVPITAANGYNGTDQYIVLKHDMGKTYNFIYIDDFDYHLAPTCLKPVDLTVTGLSSSTVDIAFDDRGSGASYEYVWGLPGYAQASGTVQSASTNPFTATGLSPQTKYELFVRNTCGGSDASQWSDPILFTTDCVPFAAPYFTGFESDDLNKMPLCWEYYESYGSSYGRVEGNGTQLNGSQNLRLYNGFTTSDTLLAITPELSGVMAGDKQIRFYSRTSDVATYLIVGTMPSPGASKQFTALDTIFYSAPNTYQENIVKLDAANGYNGSDAFVAFMHGMGSTYDDIYIDDFNYEVIPACAPTIAGDLNIGYYNYDSVYVYWTPGEGLKFNMEVGPTGFVPGTGVGNVTVLDTFAGISGLTGSTAYDIYIKDSCAAGWLPAVGPISFTTDCAPFAAPFIEGFKSGGLPNCWEVYSNTLSTSSLAFWKFSGTPAGGALANGRQAGSFAWVDGSNPSSVDTLSNVVLKSPFINVSSLNVPQLYFELFSHNTTNPGDNVSFHINLWDGAQWNDSVFAYSGDDADWQDFTVLFNNYNITGPIQLEFVVDKTTSSNASQNDFLLDSVVVQEADLCPRPDHFNVSSITSTSATFDLNAVNAASYDIEWGPRGFQQGSGTGTVVNGVSLPYNASGMNPNTAYDAYIKVNCIGGSGSVWVGPLAYSTECNGPLAAGTYTIGNGPADDFSSIDTVASVLNACGISGPVVFNIQPGNYTGALHLYNVSGVSAVNTITFNGSGNDTLGYNGAGAQATVLLDNTSHVTLSGMYIRNMNGPESWGVLITNESDSVTIDNCTIEVDATIPTGDNIPVLISNSEKDDMVEGAGVDYFTLSNSTLIGGYSGLSLEGNGDNNAALGYVIEGNSFLDFYRYAVYADDLDGATFTGNTLSSIRFSSTDGFYFADMVNFTIEKNSINVPNYGIYINDGNEGGVATTNSLIANNMVISTGDYAVYLVDVENVNVFHNTFKGEGGFYMDNHVSVDIRNNIFTSQSNYAFQMRDVPLTVDVVDHNLYYVGGSQNSIYIITGYADLAAAQIAYPALNANSVEGDPSFYSATDMHVIGVLANDAGDNSVGVTTDIDNDARPAAGATAVDIGADEYTPNLNDVGVIAIIDPQAKNCGDTNTTVTVVVRNFGLNPATGFDINVDVTGNATANLSATYNQSLASLAVDTVSMVGFNSLEGGIFTISAYTSLAGDQVVINDTLTETMQLSNAGEISIAASDSTICGPQSVSLWADTNFAGLPYVWKDLNGNQLGTGDTLDLALVDSTTSVVLSVDTANLDNFNTFVAGASDSLIGFGRPTAYNSLNTWSPIITAYQTVVIGEVKIYPQKSGTLIVNLKDRATGNVVNTVNLQVNQVAQYAPVIVDFDLTVSPGTYELVTSNASTVGQMMKNESGANYPYGDPSVFEVTGQTFGEVDPLLYSDYYFFFYDMTISSVAGCPRPSSSFTIEYGETVFASFASIVSNVTATGADVDFDASSSTVDAVTTYTWDFGDGNTGTGVMPQHTYSANGTYNVKLILEGACGKDSLTQQVVIEGISIAENMLSRSLEVYPNPTNGRLNLVFDAGSAQSAVVYLSDMTGKILLAKQFNNLNGQYSGEINLESLPKGTYILNMDADGLSAQRRIIKI